MNCASLSPISTACYPGILKHRCSSLDAHFLQVYWDPNRQAIQDKISATVVIQGSVNQVVNVQTVVDKVKE